MPAFSRFLGRLWLSGSVAGATWVLGAAPSAAEVNELISIYATHPLQVPDVGREWHAVDGRKSRVIALTARAGLGDASAAAELGRMYLAGDCVTQDPHEARHWLELAAAKDDVGAWKALARMDDEGAGGAFDPAQSIRRLEHAAGLGDGEAMGDLGIAYWQGDRVPRDKKQAKLWLERGKAIAGKDFDAADRADLALAEIAQDDGDGIGVRSHDMAVLARHDWLTQFDEQMADRSVGQAVERAMLGLGRCDELGIGGPLDRAESLRWYKAAALGPDEALAATKLASIVGAWEQNGRGKRPFDTQALEELFRGNTGGNGYYPQVRTLDLVLPPGREPAPTARKAIGALLAKASRGSQEAAYDAGWMALNGWGVHRDPAAARRWFERASGYDMAWMILGAMAMQGVGGPVDLKAARRWYTRALCRNAGCIQDTHFHETLLTTDQKALAPDFFAKLERLARDAEAGDPKAELWRARQFRQALGVMPDIARAVEWYGRAAQRGQPNALYELARLYEFGTGVPADGAQWLRLLRKAAACGQAMAASDLATAHDPSSGWPAPKSVAESQQWQRRAAELGLPQATNEILRSLERDQDFAHLAAWYRVAIAQGPARTTESLGELYRLGKGVPRDAVRARALFEASLTTRAKALYSLGLMLELGEGGPADLPRAIRLYRQANEHGSLYRLGLLYEQGRGVARNERMARSLYQQVIESETAEGGPEAAVTHEARYRLGRLLEQGRGGRRDLKRAIGLYQASESPYAVRRLGQILERGNAGKPAPAAATQLYESRLDMERFWHGPKLDFLETSIRAACLTEDMATFAKLLERAEPHDARASCLLGRLYEYGMGLPKAIRTAARLYESAGRRGSAEGYYRLAKLEQSGALGPVDAGAIARYLRSAINAERSRYEIETFGGGESSAYLDALHWLPKVRDDLSPIGDRRGFEQFVAMRDDAPGTWRSLTLAAQSGDPESLGYFRSFLFSKDRRVTLDATAIAALEGRALKGSFIARLLLLVQDANSGDRARYARDFSVVASAAQSDNVPAQTFLGLVLSFVNWFGRDRTAGYAWLDVAAATADPIATRLRDELEGKLTAKERDAGEARAIEWWRDHRRTLD